MSHIADVDATINDIASLGRAIKSCGGELLEDVKTYGWYGSRVGDYPLPAGFTVDDLGKCDHVIKFADCEWEIGVVKRKDGKAGYTLVYDFFGSNGESLEEHVGKGSQKLLNEYYAERALSQFSHEGRKARRIDKPNGGIQIVALA